MRFSLYFKDNMETDTGGSYKDSISALQKRVKATGSSSKVANEHKEFHQVLSKFGKTIDKVKL
jgi:hypothetical protein